MWRAAGEGWRALGELDTNGMMRAAEDYHGKREKTLVPAVGRGLCSQRPGGIPPDY